MPHQLPQETSKPVQMMKQSAVFNYTSLEEVQAQVLEMPYKGKDLSMILLLPNEVDGLQKVKSCTSDSSYYCLTSQQDSACTGRSLQQ